MGVWSGGVWNGRFPESEKFFYCSEAEFSKRIPEVPQKSGKKKAHKHKYFWPVTPPVTGGVSRPGGQGSKFYVLSSEPKEHKSFCPDTRPGGPVTGETRKSFM